MSQTTTKAKNAQDSVQSSDFPHAVMPEEQLEFLLNYAILEPSSHNTQPWLWEITGNEVALFADRSRAMPALDPNGRELIMSCGAALQHLRLAIRAFGYADIVSLFPNPAQPDLLAYVRLAAPHAARPEDELWTQLRHVIGRSGVPQLVFRLGYAEPVPATPRRPLGDVTM